jgi:hypothetical protein
MARCNCDSTCSCVITGADTDTTSTNVSGTGSPGNPYVVSVDTVGAAPNVPTVRVFHNADQSIPDNTVTVVAFNSERYDTDTMHDTVTLNSHITFNTAGVYEVGFSGHFEQSITYASVQALLRLNGTTYIDVSPNQGLSTTANTPRLKLGTQYKFAVNDYIEVQVYQDNTDNTARNLQVQGNYSPEFYATRLGAG